MAIDVGRVARAFCVALLGVTTGGEAFAQAIAPAESKDSQRNRQAALFQQMLADPQNLDVMFAYAGVSARLEDYEAAISTLERMLIFNANLPRVRLELGALYYRIGAYPVSERYFQSVKATPDLPGPVSERVDSYLAQIEKRQNPSQFSGRIEVGIIADSNANLGPGDRDVLFGGRPIPLTPDSAGNDDIGATLRADVVHRLDLGRINNDFWKTEASYLGRRYESEDKGNLDAIFLRTGPSLSLDALAFGPKLRPFVDAEYVQADDRALYRGAGAGVEYRDTPSDEWSIFGELRGGYRDYFSRDNEDGVVVRSRLGVGWLPARDTVITASITGQRDEADKDFDSNYEGVLRLSASFSYDPGFAFAGDKWVLSAYGSAGIRHFDDPDPSISPGRARHDRELRFGLSHTYNFKQGFYGRIGVSALWRDSNIQNFDLENFGASASLGYKF